MKDHRSAPGRPVAAPWAAAAVLVLATTAAAETTLERITREGTVRVGVANERPFGYVTADGELTGEAPEIARHVVAEIDPGIEMAPVVLPFGGLIDALRAGEIDLIAAGMFITPERCELIAFSEPTYRIGQAFAVVAGNPKGLTSYRALAERPEARIGLMAGAVEHNYAYVAGVEAWQVEMYPDPEAALAGLKTGEVDAVGLTSLSIQNLVAGEEGIEVTEQFYPEVDGERVEGYGAFGFRMEDEDLRDAFNRHLDGFIGSEAHLELVAPFGFTADMVPDRSAEELCRGE
jgi:polar amino acid transport system substrate-binding protein